ncbi:MAG TPA: hypothetical protein V6D19_06035 [Stenomitos sp.]
MLKLSSTTPTALNQLLGDRESIWNSINATAWDSLKEIEHYHHLWQQWHLLRQTIAQIEQQQHEQIAN